MARLDPRKHPKQRRAAETRERILDAAARVFAEWGYSQGTTNRIADEATVSIGTLYQYFPNKDSILVELVRRHVAAGAVLVAAHLADVPDRFEDRARALVDAVVANHADAPRLHQVLFEEAPRPPELLAELHELERAVVAAVVDMLGGEDDLDVPDLELAAWLTVATVESLTHRYVSSYPGKLDLERFAAEVTRMVVAYLGVGTSGPRSTFEETR